MRANLTSNQTTVLGVAGTHVVLPRMSFPKTKAKGLQGFGILRADHATGKRTWMRGVKSFEGIGDLPSPSIQVASQQHPFQGFQWADDSAKPGRQPYTYKIAAMRGTPGALKEAETVEVEVTTETEAGQRHEVDFSCGVAGSQEYVKKSQPPHEDNLKNGGHSGPGDFHQRIASLNQPAGGGEMRGEDLLQPGLAGVATGEPEDWRGRAEAQLEVNEVAILGNDNGPGLRCRTVDRFIIRIPQSHIPDRQGVHGKGITQPFGEAGGKLGIKPNGHAASTGWSTMRLAYATLARISAVSKSGISCRICSSERPADNKSNTSVTRIRMPRMQGRPPHWAGLKVIRSIISGMGEMNCRNAKLQPSKGIPKRQFHGQVQTDAEAPDVYFPHAAKPAATKQWLFPEEREEFTGVFTNDSPAPSEKSSSRLKISRRSDSAPPVQITP